GAAEADDQLGLAGKVCIVGTSEPILDVKYLNNGTINAVYTWDAALTGQATMNGALMLAEGKTIKPGTNLHVPGYTDIQRCPPGDSPHCFMGNAILVVTKKNLKQHTF
ncbi:MAG: hypothetical protein ACP5VR_11305, partial [Acidimicrobiales bacterium]